MSDSSTKSSGFSLSTLLFVVFLVLKLTHTIDWSWWWVTAPLWIGWGLTALFLLIAVLIVAAFSRG
jgi:membrane protein YdbS with pleckstrin-like domain